MIKTTLTENNLQTKTCINTDSSILCTLFLQIMYKILCYSVVWIGDTVTEIMFKWSRLAHDRPACIKHYNNDPY